jgi:hypothetical protein
MADITDADITAVFDHETYWDRGQGQWVSIAYVQGDGYDEIADAGTHDMAVYLAQWDMGSETDEAHTTDGGQWGSSDRVSIQRVGGQDYLLAWNADLGYASLNRRPLR